MTSRLSRRAFNRGSIAAGASLAAHVGFDPTAAAQSDDGLEGITIAVTGSTGSEVSLLDLASGIVSMFDVGHAPWGIALGEGTQAFVSTAQGLAEVDLASQSLINFMPFSTQVSYLSYGEYRPGGMGLARLAIDDLVAVGRYFSSGPSTVELFDVKNGEVAAIFEVGVRPFQVLAAESGSQVYSIDHDSFTITVIDVMDGSTYTLPMNPLGNSGFDKPHYAACDAQGRLVLPFQGVTTIRINPENAETESFSSAANTHQHGIARIPGADRYAIVGTGPAGRAIAGPNLTVQDLEAGEEIIWPLELPHEDVVVTPNGEWALLTGGYTFQNLGWDGVTAVKLATGEQRSWTVPYRPLGIIIG